MEIPYRDQNVYLGTLHGKEFAIAKVLAARLNMRLITVSWNTDVLGTFSGEVKRNKSVKDTLRAKALRTHELSGGNLVLVSEGSFGPHPAMPLVKSNHEMLLFKDFALKREIFADTISYQTNIDELEFTRWSEAGDFLKNVSFPSHGIIITDRKENPSIIKKGIKSRAQLKKAFIDIRQVHSQAFLMTDMRAHMNPTRMKVIRQAARELVKKIKSLCPKCSCPGWDIVDYLEGLPCSQCRRPSQTVKEVIYKCQECLYRKNAPRPDKKLFIAPDHCEFCNP